MKYRLALPIVLFASLLAGAFFLLAAGATTPVTLAADHAQAGNQVTVIGPVVPSVGPPVTELPVAVMDPSQTTEGNPPRRQRDIKLPDSAPPSGPDPLLGVQASVPAVSGSGFLSPTLNFDGQGFTNLNPPDTVGDVGIDHYIQMINCQSGSCFVIYNKEDGSIADGPFTLSTLGGTGACASGLGDPIVVFDQLAGRWVLTEFAAGGNALCVYVSETEDPITTNWFAYNFPTPNFPDYPKYGVWPDAYYVSTNENLPAVYALERLEMLNGQPATMQRFTAPPLGGFPFQALTPADADGATPPPADAPGIFMRHRDDEVHDPGPDPDNDFVEVFEFDVDFDNPANSTFGLADSIAVTEFDSDLCGLVSFSCVPQPGTSTQLDPLREVVMWRLQYRNFGSHQTLVGNFVTDVDDTDHHGVRWFELRKTGDPWT
ncbi:MAG: hypothetical protein ACRDIB_15165, partial [Ardenticatenaceae bacterium]